VIARLKDHQQISQASKPDPKPAKEEEKVEVPQETKVEVPQETEGLEEKKPVETPEKIPREQQIAMEIEMLQNDGRFRGELLHQLQELNRGVTVIAGVLVDLVGKDGKK